MKHIKVSFGFLGAPLAAILIVLKAVGLTDLAWVWVLAPLWGPLALVAAIVAVPLVFILLLLVMSAGVMTVIRLFETYDEWRKRKARAKKAAR